MSTAARTRDEDTIREWVEERNGHPAQVKGTEGLLRIDFEDGDEREQLEQISWEDFFAVFEDRGLSFMYDPEGESRFNKLVLAEDDGKGGRSGAATPSRPADKGASKADDEDEDEDADEDDFEDDDEDEDDEDEDDDEDEEDFEDEDEDDEDEDEDDDDDEGTEAGSGGSSSRQAKSSPTKPGGRKGSSSSSSRSKG